MAWATCTLDYVRALLQQARVDAAMDADSDAQAALYFDLYHAGLAAGVRAKVAAGNHELDTDPLRVPPEFVPLVALQIAGLILSRPGNVAEDPKNPFTLTGDQRAMLKRLEAHLDAVADGAPVTSPDTGITDGRGASATLVRPGIGYDKTFTGLGAT